MNPQSTAGGSCGALTSSPLPPGSLDRRQAWLGRTTSLARSHPRGVAQATQRFTRRFTRTNLNECERSPVALPIINMSLQWVAPR
jgi:hypothetical protein